MVDDTIKTSVDALIDLLKQTSKMELSKAAKQLDLPVEVVQSWVDFLVEEKIVGIEYKFTTPYIYLNEETKKTIQKKESKPEDVTIDNFKQAFTQKANDKMIPEHKAKDLWKNHLLSKAEKKKDFFFKQARKMGFFNAEELWIEYKRRLTAL